MKILMHRSVLLLVMCLCSVSVFSEHVPFGRIFTSDLDRKKLDSLRRNKNTGSVSQLKISNIMPRIVNKKIEFSGYVLDEKGRAIVWVNGKTPLDGKVSSLVISPPNKDSSKVNVQHMGKQTALKPGQAWLLKDNVVREVYELLPEKLLEKNMDDSTENTGTNGEKKDTRIDEADTDDSDEP